MTTSPLLSGLVEHRARLSGDILAVEERLDQMRATLAHLDATVRHVEPSYRPEAIAPKRGRVSGGLFAPRELNRLCLDTVRAADQPLSSKEVAQAVMRRKGLDPRDKALVQVVEKAADKSLRRQDGELVRRVLFGPRAVGWAIADDREA